MNKILLVLFCLSAAFGTQAQQLVLSEDFDSGTGAWTLTGQWATTTAQAVNGANSLTDSPGGVYLNNQTTYATLTNSFDLSTSLDANVHFKAKYDIENGFDYLYVECSPNNGNSWTIVETINGEGNLSLWTNFDVSIGGFVGNSQVKFRFRLYTDQGYQSDGIYIDSLRIYKDTVDNAAPLIVHTPAAHYEGQFGVNERTASITDISGVALAELHYQVDGGSIQTITAADTTGTNFTFQIPAQEAGAFVDYWFEAVDSSAQQNTLVTDTFKYVAGNYVKYENGTVGSIVSFGTTSTATGCAMRMTLSGNTTLRTAFIGNYTDVNNPNDSMVFHVWSNNAGNPGTDLITPITMVPAANLLQPYLITRIDLRPYEAQLDNLSGDVFIGFTVPSGTVWVTQNPGTTGRVRSYNGTTWSTLGTVDFTFRIVQDTVPPVANFDYDNSGDPVVVFTDLSLNDPSSWMWTFGDGDTSYVQNPTHTYDQLGAYTTCLTVSNSAGSDQHCESYLILNGPPNALFTYNSAGDPTIVFTDNSYPAATTWAWTFGDGDTSSAQHPTHYYTDTGDYEVCLVASNAFGSDTACQTLHIYNRAPEAFFTSMVISNNSVDFTDLSGFLPTSWHWDFDNAGDTSISQNPSYQYPITGGTFNVCLVAANQYGASAPYCDEIELPDLTIGIAETEAAHWTMYPNPANEMVYLEGAVLVRVVNTLGDVVATYSRGSRSFSVMDLPAGVYSVVVISNGKSDQSLIVVE